MCNKLVLTMNELKVEKQGPRSDLKEIQQIREQKNKGGMAQKETEVNNPSAGRKCKMMEQGHESRYKGERKEES